MSQEFSELIAMGCPDLNLPNGIQTLIDPERRLSVKQMTATELAAARAVAAAEIEMALAKAASIAQAAKVTQKSMPAVTPSEMECLEAIDDISIEVNKRDLNSRKSSTRSTSSSESPEKLSISTRERFPPRERSVSIPINVLEESMQKHFLSMTSKVNEIQQKKQDAEQHLNSAAEKRAKPLNGLSTADLSPSNLSPIALSPTAVSPNASKVSSNSKSSLEDADDLATASSSKSFKIVDSIELLRRQRRERDHRETQRERSLSLSSQQKNLEEDMDEYALLRSQRQHERERSAAPDRLHSASTSSLVSSTSASASVNASANASRRGSTSSNAVEAAGFSSSIATAATASTPVSPASPLIVAEQTAPQFPLSKTTSVPNFEEKRRNSLVSLFPNPPAIAQIDRAAHVLPKAEMKKEIPTPKAVHRTKTPPPAGVKLGVTLKKVSPPRTQITVKKNEGPMFVLRRVEKKTEPHKSILDDDKPLYHLSIVRSDEHKSSTKPKPKALQKSATTTTVPGKPNPGGILTGPQVIRTAQPLAVKPQRPQPGVPITIQKIEGDKIIIIKKIQIPKNGKIPEQYLKVGERRKA